MTMSFSSNNNTQFAFTLVCYSYFTFTIRQSEADSSIVNVLCNKQGVQHNNFTTACCYLYFVILLHWVTFNYKVLLCPLPVYLQNMSHKTNVQTLQNVSQYRLPPLLWRKGPVTPSQCAVVRFTTGPKPRLSHSSCLCVYQLQETLLLKCLTGRWIGHN